MNEYQKGEKETLEKIKDLLKTDKNKDEVIKYIDRRLNEKYEIKIGDEVKYMPDGYFGYVLNTSYNGSKDSAIVMFYECASPQVVRKKDLEKTGDNEEKIAQYIKRGAEELGLIKPAKRGTWEYLPLISGIRCSECGLILAANDVTIPSINKKRKTTYRYCPECGAKMEELVYDEC